MSVKLKPPSTNWIYTARSICFEVLDQYRNSLLIFGEFSNESLDQVLDKAKNVNCTDVTTWKTLIEFLAEKELICLRFIGFFDDPENGVFVYEPFPVFEKYGNWDARN